MATSTTASVPVRLPRRVQRIETLLAGMAAYGLAWLVIPPIGPAPWWMHLLIGLACTGFAVGLVTTSSLRRNRDQKAAFRYIDLLCRLDPQDLSQDNLSAVLPKLSDSNPWQNVFSRVRDCLVEYSQRLQAAEASRTSGEVRYKQVQQERDQVMGILNTLSDPVLAIDHYNELYMANPSAHELFAIDANCSKSSQSLDQIFLSQDLLEMLLDARQRKLPTQRVGEVAIPDAVGSERWFRVVCRGVATSLDANETGGLSEHGAVAVLSDISDRKTLQKRNAEFVANASHEMKTPLSSIRAYVELLEDGDVEDDTTREEFLKVISGQAGRLQRLIENLLNLARIEAGVVEVNKDNCSLNDILEEAFRVVQPTAEQKQIELIDSLSPLYLGVYGDRDMLLQSAINLLSNAIKYTPSGGRVELVSRMEENQVVFEVSDTGVGLSEEDCQRVFEKFYRVKKDRNMASGTGLGLPLAKHIVDDVHGGELSVTSRVDEGSTFRIALPSIGRHGK